MGESTDLVKKSLELVSKSPDLGGKSPESQEFVRQTTCPLATVRRPILLDLPRGGHSGTLFGGLHQQGTTVEGDPFGSFIIYIYIYI